MKYFMKAFILVNTFPAFRLIEQSAEKIIDFKKVKELVQKRLDIPVEIHPQNSKLNVNKREQFLSAFREYNDDDPEEIKKSTVTVLAKKTSKHTYEFHFNLKLLANNTIDRVTLNAYSVTNSVTKIHRIDGLKKIKVARIGKFESKWIKKDITSDLKYWVTAFSHEQNAKYILKFKCKTEAVCIPSSKNLYLDVAFRRTVKKRNKINHDCSKVSTTCCRHHVQINLKDLNWRLVAPTQFNYYYCAGSCERTSKKSAYGAIVTSSNKDVPSVCCTPLRKQGLNIMYTDGLYARQKVIPDLMAAECGCAE